MIRGKGNRIDRLPLPHDVGEALGRLPVRRPARSDVPGAIPAFLRPAGRDDGSLRRGRCRGPRRRVPGWRWSVPTGSGTRWRPRVCAAAPRWPRSLKCSGITQRRARQLLHCRPGHAGHWWCGAWPGARTMNALHQSADDYLAIRRACGYALRQEGRMLASYLDHLEHARREADHGGRGAGVGHRTASGQAALVGQATQRRPRVRPLPIDHGPGHRSPAAGSAGYGSRAPDAISVFAGADHCPDVRSSPPGLPTAAATFETPRRADGLHRAAYRRGDAPRSLRRRLRQRSCSRSAIPSTVSPGWCRCTRATTTALRRLRTPPR